MAKVKEAHDYRAYEGKGTYESKRGLFSSSPSFLNKKGLRNV